MKTGKRILALALTLALTAGLALPAGAYTPEYRVDTTIYSEAHADRATQVAKGFAIASRVFRGDGNGALNWEGTLTRVEAATMIVRLMGLDDAAEAAKGNASPFSDVPAWANGYINVAYEKGVSRGVGEGRFAPEELCGVKDFLTMLYRLTHLTEGTDFTWATSLDDFLEDMGAIDGYWSWGRGMTAQKAAEEMRNYYYFQDGPFTREGAADVMYFMLNVIAGPEGESLGDILAAECGMSDLLLYDHSVYRNPRRVAGQAQTSMTFENFSSSKTPTVASIQGGKLQVQGADREKIQITLFPDRETFGTDAELYDGGQSIPLPKEDVTVSMLYQQLYDEKGELLATGVGHSESFRIFYQDGAWSMASGNENSAGDYGYVLAYQSQEHWQSFLDSEATFADLPDAPQVKALADKLTAGKRTELEKADAICEWVATHIYYDYDAQRLGFAGGDQSGDAVLESHRAVCQGYTLLTLMLMRYAGLKCYEESGRGNNGFHAWNVAYLDGNWVVIDNTWDSPLEYNKTKDLGYQCRYDDPELIWEWRTPEDIMEPGASRRGPKVYFNMDLDEFYTDHRILRDPTYANKTVQYVQDVLK